MPVQLLAFILKTPVAVRFQGLNVNQLKQLRANKFLSNPYCKTTLRVDFELRRNCLTCQSDYSHLFGARLFPVKQHIITVTIQRVSKFNGRALARQNVKLT